MEGSKIRNAAIFLAIALIIALLPLALAQTNQQQTQQQTTQQPQLQNLTLEQKLEQIKKQQQQQKVGAIPTFFQFQDETQDFVVQVIDYQPKVVRSDLLEEQDIPIYAKIALININPIISVPNIRSIQARILPELEGTTFPRELVSTVSWQPLPGRRLATDDAGYLIVRLKGRIPEAQMPETLKIPVEATILYDLEFTPGVRHETKFLKTFPIPQKDAEWQSELQQHAFWNKAGYIRVTEVRGGRVIGQIYTSRLQPIQSFDLSRQRQEQTFLLPQLAAGGVSTFAGRGQGKVILESVEFPQKRAELLLNVQGKRITARVAEGEVIFEGSNWVVKGILPIDQVTGGGKVVLNNRITAEIVELILGSSIPSASLFTPLRYGIVGDGILEVGSKGEGVKRLQQDLKDLARVAGKYDDPGAVDGTFGPSTEDALEKFQTENGLTPNGILDAATARVLISELSKWKIAIPERERITRVTGVLSPEQFGVASVGTSTITSQYCSPRSDSPPRNYHYGYDFSPRPGRADAGTEVKAVYDGEVLNVIHWGDDANDYAVWVKSSLADGTEFVTSYGHLSQSSITVRNGQAIKKGDFVGKIYKDHLDVKMFWLPLKEEDYWRTAFNFDKGQVGMWDECPGPEKVSLASPSDLIKEANKQADILFDALDEIKNSRPEILAQSNENINDILASRNRGFAREANGVKYLTLYKDSTLLGRFAKKGRVWWQASNPVGASAEEVIYNLVIQDQAIALRLDDLYGQYEKQTQQAQQTTQQQATQQTAPDILLPEKAREAYDKAISNYQNIIRTYPDLEIPAENKRAPENKFWAVAALRGIIELTTNVESTITKDLEYEAKFGAEKKVKVTSRKTDLGLLKERASQDRLNALQTFSDEYPDVFATYDEGKRMLENFFLYDTTGASAILEDVTLLGDIRIDQTITAVLSKIIVPGAENYVDVTANGEYKEVRLPVGQQIIEANRLEERIDVKLDIITENEIKIIVNGETKALQNTDGKTTEEKKLREVEIYKSESGDSILYATYNKKSTRTRILEDGIKEEEDVASITFKAQEFKSRLRVQDTFFGKEVSTFSRDSLTLDRQALRQLGLMRLALKANLIEEARISIVPFSTNGKSVSRFFLHIGIEKRLIQLSPAQMARQANASRALAADIKDITDSMEGIISTWRKACFVTSTALFVKSSIEGIRGESFARGKVMTVYKEICAEQVGYNKKYKQIGDCFRENSDKINRATSLTLEAYKRATDAVKEKGKGGITIVNEKGERGVDYEELKKILQGKEDKLRQILQETDVNAANVINSLNSYKDYETRTGATILTPSEIQDTLFNIEMASLDLDDNEFLKGYSKRVGADLKLLERKGEGYSATLRNFDKIWNKVEGKTAGEIKEKIYRVTSTGIRQPIKENEIFIDYIRARQDSQQLIGPYELEDGKEIALVREVRGTQAGAIDYVWKIGIKGDRGFNIGKQAEGTRDVVVPIKVSCPLGDELNIKFYETPYKGLPYVTPFPTPFGDGHAKVRRYDTAGNPIEVLIRFPVQQGGCDEFLYVKGQEIPGDRNDALQRAFQVIKTLTNLQNKDRGVLVPLTARGNTGLYRISGNFIGAPEGQCEDFMSPEDCEILYQTCDPVMCPASRFNFGGRWHVQDVVQTGISGSILLGLPNYPHPAVPICLPGVRAGLQNVASIFDAYAQCLDDSRLTGKTSGICDRIRSIYICEMAWKEGMAIANAEGGLLDFIAKSAFKVQKGGLEYMYFKDSLDKVGESFRWFTTTYASPVFSAFKARTGQDVGTFICKAAFFGNIPGLGGVLEELSKPESPPQFFSTLEEIPYSDVQYPGTTIPQSQYKVFFHIFAGDDKGIFYRVFLADPTPVPGFQATPIFEITGTPSSQRARGFIPKGQFVSETLDFLGPAGYRQICVEIDGNVNCGFKKVTTEFGLNFLSDLYLKQQLEQPIKNAQECIGGTSSTTPLASLPFAGTEAISASLHGGLQKGGIVRVCDARSPGEGINEDRWKNVGSCGKIEGFELSCWLDTFSVKSALTDLKFKDEILQRAQKTNLKQLLEDDKFFSFDESKERLAKVRDEALKAKTNDDFKRVLQLAKEVYERSIVPKERAEALLIIGDTFSKIADPLVKKEALNASEDLRVRGLLPVDEEAKEGTARSGAIESGKRYAVLVVGGGPNQDAYINDINELEAHLKNSGWKTYKIISDGSTIENAKRSGDKIFMIIKTVEELEEEDDYVLFAFSDHGNENILGLGQDIIIQKSELKEAFRNFESKHFAVIIEACNSASFADLIREDSIGIFSSGTRDKSVACQIPEILAPHNHKHSVFMFGILLAYERSRLQYFEDIFSSVEKAIKEHRDLDFAPQIIDNYNGKYKLFTTYFVGPREIKGDVQILPDGGFKFKDGSTLTIGDYTMKLENFGEGQYGLVGRLFRENRNYASFSIFYKGVKLDCNRNPTHLKEELDIFEDGGRSNGHERCDNVIFENFIIDTDSREFIGVVRIK